MKLGEGYSCLNIINNYNPYQSLKFLSNIKIKYEVAFNEHSYIIKNV